MDFRIANIKMLQQTIMISLETSERIKNISKEKDVKKGRINR